MTRFASALLTIVLFALLLLPLLIGSPALAADHPRLLFDARDVPTLRGRLAGPLKPVAVALRAAVELPYVGPGDYPKTPDVKNQWFRQDIRALADTGLSYAFASLMFRDGGVDRIFPELTKEERATLAARANELARNYLLGVTAPDFPDWLFPEHQEGTAPDLPMAHLLFDVSLAYDWLHSTLTEAEREQIRRRIAINAPRMHAAANDPNTWWARQYTQNHFWLNNAALGMAALAFDGEIPGTEPWRETAAKAMQTVQLVLDDVAGGAWHEGIGYSNYGMLSLIPFSIANQKLKGGPDYADARFVRDYPIFRMYGMPGTAAHRREFVVYSDFSSFTNDDTVAVARYVAKKYRDGRAAWYADQFTQGQRQGRSGLTTWPPAQRGIILSAILYDEKVKPTPPSVRGAAWDLDFFAEDLSMMLSRSGWGENESLLAFKTGRYGGHGAVARIRENRLPGELLNFGHSHADDMGVYFFAEGEWLTTRVPGYYIGRGGNIPANKTEFANSLLIDGRGQILEGPRTSSTQSAAGFYDRVSTIPLRGSTAHYSFSLGAGSKLYPPELGLETFGRAILFVERRFPVVRDVIRASKPHRYEIAYHAVDDLSRESGDWLRLNAKNGKLLGVKVLSPANFALRTAVQKAGNLQNFDPDASMTAAFIAPPEDTASTTFLTALVPVRDASAWGEKARIDPIDPAVPHRGAVITNTGIAGERIYVAFTDEPTETAEAGGIRVTGMAGVVKHQGEQIVRTVLAAGSRLDWQGRTQIQIEGGPPATLEADYTRSSLALSGDARRVRVYAPRATTVTYNGTRAAFKRDGEYIVTEAKETPAAGKAASGRK